MPAVTVREAQHQGSRGQGAVRIGAELLQLFAVLLQRLNGATDLLVALPELLLPELVDVDATMRAVVRMCRHCCLLLGPK